MLNVIHSILYLLIFFLSSLSSPPFHSPSLICNNNNPINCLFIILPSYLYECSLSFHIPWMDVALFVVPCACFWMDVALFLGTSYLLLPLKPPSLHRTQYAPICHSINALFVTRMTLGLGGVWTTRSLCAAATWAEADPGNTLTLISSPLHSKPRCSFSTRTQNEPLWRPFLWILAAFFIFFFYNSLNKNY